MTVMIDPLMKCIPNGRWRWTESCHMFADDPEELHAFAASIGLRREWFQDDPRLPHYDLNPARRRQAVAAGAIEVDRRTMVGFMRRRAQEGGEGPPWAKVGPIVTIAEPEEDEF